MSETCETGSCLRVLDLFSGIGGFSLGLERTGGFKTVAFCEIEEYPRKVLRKHWPGVPIYEDVRELTADRLAANGIGVDVITGGFPCQDISDVGLKTGLSGSRSGLFYELSRLVGEIRPQYIILENVAALLYRGLHEVLGELATLGYDAEWHVIGGHSVSRPQRRNRVWILAYTMRRDGQMDGLISRSWWESEQIQRYRTSYQESEPDMVGMADGIPNYMDRLKGLGNAVVPQISELIGRAILENQAR